MVSANKAVDLQDLITKADAARLRGISRSSMQDLIDAYPEQLQTVEIGGVPFLRRSQVQTFLTRRALRRQQKERVA